MALWALRISSFPSFSTALAFAASVASVATVGGCAGSDTIIVAGGDGGAVDCPADQHRDTTGACIAGPPLECEAGSMKALGELTCTPIGWTDCEGGFEKDPSGWGCREVLADACTGATRAALGKTTCVPVGDCTAAFPPANATLFVSPTGPLNATHFHSIESAALASRAGDVIAIDAGTYHESVQMDRAISLVGRCAEQVILAGTGLTTPGLIVDARTTVRGLTVRKFPTGIQLSTGLDMADTVLTDNLDAGIYSEGSAIDVKIARSVIRNTRPGTIATAFGIDLALGTTADIVDTEISASEGAGIIVTPGSTVSLASSVIRGGAGDSKGEGGFGINAQGGVATVTHSAIIDNTDSGLRAGKAGTLTVDHAVVRGTLSGSHGFGNGLAAADRSTLTATNVVVTGTHGVGAADYASKMSITDSVVRAQVPAPDGDFGDGVYVFGAGTLNLSRVAILDNARAGADIFDASTEASFDHVLISGTKPLPAGDMGLGIAVAFGSHAAITSSIIASNHHTGIYVFEGSTLDVTKTAVRDTSLENKGVPLGHGILVTDSNHAVISGCEVRRSAGIGLAFSKSAAVVKSSTIADNAVGIHAQDGSMLLQVDVAPEAPSGTDVSVSADTTFDGNGTRIGSGTVPLPDPLPGPKL
jgi:hypothetical protein